MTDEREPFHRPGCTLAPEHTGDCLVPKGPRQIRAMRTGRPRGAVRVQTDERIARRDGSAGRRSP